MISNNVQISHGVDLEPVSRNYPPRQHTTSSLKCWFKGGWIHVFMLFMPNTHPTIQKSQHQRQIWSLFFFLNLASIRWYRQTTDMIVQLGLSNYYSLYCSLKCACIGRHTSLCDTDSESLSKGVWFGAVLFKPIPYVALTLKLLGWDILWLW